MPAPPAGGLLLALYGPTSSGKTAFSVELAQRIERTTGRKVVVISADSRQVYRYMDIGTSKTMRNEMGGVRHEMLDIVEPVRKLELADYSRRARTVITEAFDGGQIPFLVGGTGVYVQALLGGWDLDRTAEARVAMRRDFPRAMAADAYATLRRLDRAAAARIHPNNYEAVINALAATVGGQDGGTVGQPWVRSVVFGLDPGAQAIDERVALTFDRQVKRGLLEEVLSLNARYELTREFAVRRGDSPNQVLHTHGYREFFEVAADRGKTVLTLTDADIAEVRRRVVERIRAYTRRQRSWFRKLPEVRMVTSPGKAYALAASAGGLAAR